MSRPALLAAAMVAAIAVSGCSGTPTPGPTETPLFATEEEAFAAAEETYRAYVDALNRVDLSDPETFEDVFAWTTGELNASDRESFSSMHAQGLVVSGQSTLALVQPVAMGIDPLSVSLAVCLDVSSVDVVAPDGASIVDSNREDVQAQLVTLEPAASVSGLAVATIADRSDDQAC